MTLLAIPTRYAGCRFRSRLEARWAIFFDTLRIPWRYEPEGFHLSSGNYLPDFWLPSIDSWYEVKGAEPNVRDCEKIDELAAVSGKRVLVAIGDIPRPLDLIGNRQQLDSDSVIVAVDQHGCDEPYLWCVCPRCGKWGVEYEGRGARVCPIEVGGRGHTANHPLILDAYTAARGARFEHGEAA